MRFYAVVIDGAPVAFSRAPGTPFVPGAQFCSVVDTGAGFGFANDPSALRCQMHFEMTSVHTAVTGGFVRLWGPDLSMLSQASNLVNLPCGVYGGFWGGGPRRLALELAQAEAPFAGLIYSGRILTAMGNWVGQDMTLDLFLSSSGPPQAASSGQDGGGGGGGGGGVQEASASAQRFRQRQRIGRPMTRARPPVSVTQFDNPLGGITGDIGSLASAFSTFMSGGWMQSPINMIHNMMPGMSLDSAMQQTLGTVFPTSKIVSLIKGGLTLPYQDAGFYQTLGQYAGYAKTLSKSIVNGAGGGGGLPGIGALSVGSMAGGGGGSGGNYDGVNIYPVKDKIFLHDGTRNSGEVTLRFIDLIGQPTWVKPGVINFMTPMRADIVPTMTVTLPPNTLQTIGQDAINMYGPHGGSGILPHSLAINFQGSFTVQHVMVIGDSRHPDGKSWALSVQATLGGAGGAGQGGGGGGGTTEA